MEDQPGEFAPADDGVALNVDTHRMSDEEDNLDGLTQEELRNELNHLLDRASGLTKRKDKLNEECLEHLNQAQYDQLYEFLQQSARDDTKLTDEEVNKFIFGRIGYEKVEVVSLFYQLFSVEASIEENECSVGKLFQKMSQQNSPQ